MPTYRVVIIFDSSRSEIMEADDPWDAVDKANANPGTPDKHEVAGVSVWEIDKFGQATDNCLLST